MGIDRRDAETSNMAFKTTLIFVALLSTAYCNPLGATTVCESAPNLLPGYGSTTVCETAPNLLPYGLPYGLGATTVCESSPNLLPYGQTTVCESVPSLGYGYGSLGLGYPLVGGAMINPYPIGGIGGSTTVCETAPRLGLPYGLPYPGGYAQTVCETVPRGIGWGVPPLGVGATTVCESSPNLLGYPYGLGLGLGYGVPSIGGVAGSISGVAGLGPFGVPSYNPLGASTVCETAPNLGLGLGLPYGRAFL